MERNNRTRSSMSIVWIGKGLENMQRRMDAGDNLIAQKKSAFFGFSEKIGGRNLHRWNQMSAFQQRKQFFGRHIQDSGLLAAGYCVQ